MPNKSSVSFTLKEMGHTPSFKNSKMILWQQRRIMTKPDHQHWMQKAVQSIESQLLCLPQMRGIGTMTGPQALSLIASFLPLDDSRKWIPEHSVNTRLVSKGSEGAEVLIERLDL